MFNRDIAFLYQQYKPLRESIASKNKYKFLKDNTRGYTTSSQSYDDAGYDDLQGYIDTEFVRLVKEYDINGPIDFPGYIANKLGKRVLGTHLSRRSRDIKNETAEGNSSDLVFSDLEDPKDYFEIEDDSVKDAVWEKLAGVLLKQDASELCFNIGYFMVHYQTSNFTRIKSLVKNHNATKDSYTAEEFKNSYNHVANTLLNVNFLF